VRVGFALSVLPPELPPVAAELPLSVTKPPAPPWLLAVMVGVTVMLGLTVGLAVALLLPPKPPAPPCALSVGLKRRSLLAWPPVAFPPWPPKPVPPVALVSPTVPPVAVWS